MNKKTVSETLYILTTVAVAQSGVKIGLGLTRIYG